MPYLKGKLKGELTNAELRRLVSAHNKLNKIIIPKGSNRDDIIKLIKDKAGKELVKINTFDVYQGDNVPNGKKSVAFNLKWQSFNKTLIDEDIDRLVKKIVNSLSKEIKAELRS